MAAAGRSLKWVARAGVVAVALAAVLTVAPLVLRARFHYPIVYNEGWNAYRAQWAQTGKALYGEPPALTVVIYPPFSFHIVGLAGRWLGGVNRAGRAISLAALAAIAIEIGLMVALLGGGGLAAAFAASLWILWVALFGPNYVGMNDPHLLGLALALAAFLLYLRAPGSLAALIGSCLVFCVAGFIKHGVVALPLAVTFHILIWNRRRFPLWCLLAAVTIGLLALLACAVDGPYFLQHLFWAKVYSIGKAVQTSLAAAVLLLPALALSLAWSRAVWRRRRESLLVYALVIALIAGAGFCGGSAVYINYFFEAWVMMAAILGLTMRWPAKAAPLVPVVMLLWLVPHLWSVLKEPPGAVLASYARHERMYRSNLAYLKSLPGLAVCTDLLLCFDAGQPQLLDVSDAYEAFDTGRLSERLLLDRLERGEIATVQWYRQPEDGRIPFASHAFAAVMRSHFQPIEGEDQHVFFRFRGAVPSVAPALPAASR